MHLPSVRTASKNNKRIHISRVAVNAPPSCDGTSLANVLYANKVYYNDRLYGILPNTMKISQKGLYALQAMMMLARHYNQGAIRIRDIAYEEALPEKFLELILLELKNARMVESSRGARGGYQLRRPPAEIHLSEIIRLIDGPLAPIGDAE